MSKKKTKLLREPFDREKHVYKNDAFVEMVKDAIRFFNGIPVHPVPTPERFYGTGVYGRTSAKARHQLGNRSLRESKASSLKWVNLLACRWTRVEARLSPN